jgi:serine/threonine protein phosphatase PrpC
LQCLFFISFTLIPDIEPVAKQLVELAIDHNSTDNITVIVLLLKAPNLIKKDWFSIGYKATMDSTIEGNSTLVADTEYQVNIFIVFLIIGEHES